MVEVRGEPLLRRSTDALRDMDQTVVVGPRRDGFPGVVWVREEPPGGGPVAALAAGLAASRAADEDRVAVLAGDLTGVTRFTVDRLGAAIGDAEGAVLVDADGRRQWLIGMWQVGRLRSVLPDDPAGASLRRTLGGLRVVELPALPGEDSDVDTPDDLDRARD